MGSMSPYIPYMDPMGDEACCSERNLGYSIFTETHSFDVAVAQLIKKKPSFIPKGKKHLLQYRTGRYQDQIIVFFPKKIESSRIPLK